ncbi:MAG: radical SAM protein, partial [Coriobacteriia bacterium]|nr:radical SAM protein [Coriobacteriia bacterium]
SWPRLLLDWHDRQLEPLYRPGPDDGIASRPALRRDLLDRRRYITLNTVEAVRGCQFNCAFCAYPKAFGHHVLTRPVADVIAEIQSLPRKEVVFPDVNLTADPDYLRELLTAMIPLRKWWFGLTTSNVPLDEELVKLFAKSGCKGLLIGFESVNAGSQKEMHKGINKPDQYKTLMDTLHRYGIMVMGCFAFGADEDGPDVFERTVQLAAEIQIDLPRYAIFTPFPTTEYYQQLAREGRITETDWALYDVEHCVFEPKQMSQQELEAGIRYAWQASYSVRGIMRRWRWLNPRLFWFGWLYWLLNLGYRRYAKHFEIFAAEVMTDNSYIPD